MLKRYEEKILLVDDDSKNLQVAMNILKDYNVIFAQSGEKALELLEKNNFDLILLDVIMPNLDGYTVCKKIKENPLTSKIPIIFLTFKDEEKDIVKGFDLGAVDYVTKPFFSEVLLKRVEVHLKLASVMNELKKMNHNLNEIVDEQIIELREKDQIIHRQSRIAAMSDIIGLISSQWKVPLDKLKLYLQSLDIKMEVCGDNDSKKIFQNSLHEVKKLNEIMEDFHKFFNNSKNKKNVNIKVAIDNAIITLKDKLAQKNIKLIIDGDNLLCMNIINEELIHIFYDLMEYSLMNFDEKEKKFISILIEEGNDSLYITYEDNSRVYNDNEVEKIFSINQGATSKEFDLGFYLVKVFIKKNRGMILPKATENGIKYIIRFDK